MKKDYSQPMVEFVTLTENDLFWASNTSECDCHDAGDAVCEGPGGFCMDF